MTTNFQLAYSPMLVFLPTPQPTFCHYVDDLPETYGSIYLDPHDVADI